MSDVAAVVVTHGPAAELGSLDPGYRLYDEDIDLCYRAAKAGRSAGVRPAAVAMHR